MMAHCMSVRMLCLKYQRFFGFFGYQPFCTLFSCSKSSLILQKRQKPRTDTMADTVLSFKKNEIVIQVEPKTAKIGHSCFPKRYSV